MTSTANVLMGEIAVSKDKENILETFVGSCVALCLYDIHAKVAGMAHVMLPSSGKGKMPSKPGYFAKYADQAVETLLKMMLKNDVEKRRIKAKIVGGANMFSHEGGTSLFNIGERNVQALRKLLKEHGIPIVAEDVGMNYGRKVKFSVELGDVVVSSRKEGKRKL